MKTIEPSQPDRELSNEMNELIGYRLPWIIRRGNVLFVLILLFLAAVCWFIRYPDIVSGALRGGELLVSRNDTARIKKGQTVLIPMKSRSGGKSGLVTGIVDSISDLPAVRDSFMVVVDLPRGLEGNDVNLRASVVTEDRRLIERIFSRLTKL